MFELMEYLMQVLDNPLQLLFLFSFIVPLYCLITRRDNWLIAWIAFSATIEIFNNLSFVTLSSTKIAGIFLIPYALKHIHKIIQITPGKIWLGIFGLLVTLGLIYGYISPWPDYSESRGLRQLPQGRSVLYLGSYFLEMMVIIFLATKLNTERNFKFLIWGLIAGGIACTTGILIERFFHLDLYYLFTGYDARDISYRSRGFNYEPRGAGYTAIITLFTVLVTKMQFKYRVVLICSIYPAFYFSASVSSAIIIILVSVVMMCAYLWYRKQLKGQALAFAQGLAIVAIITLLTNTPFNSIKYKITEQLATINKTTNEEAIAETAPATSNTPAPAKKNIWATVAGEKSRAYITGGITDVNFPSQYLFLKRFEVFDAAAIDFFIENPRHLIFGTGPGLISLAASEKRLINSLPHIGVLREISNYGLVGFSLWLTLLIMFTYRLISNAIKDPDTNMNIERLSLFAIIILCYGLQAKIFYIFAIAIGLASFIKNQLSEDSVYKR